MNKLHRERERDFCKRDQIKVMSELDPPGYNEDEDSDFEPGRCCFLV